MLLKLFSGLTAFALLFLWADAAPREPFDFARLWKSCELLLHQQNPFELPPLHTYASDFDEGDGTGPAFFWPPCWLLPFVPFALFSYGVGKQLYTAMMMAVSVWSLFSCARVFSCRLTGAFDRGASLLATAALLPIGGFANCVYWASPSWIILAGLTGVLSFVANKRWDVITGAFLYLVGIKIQIGAPIIAIVLLWSLRHKRFGIPCGFFSILVAGTALLCIVYPELFTDYLKVFSGTDLGQFTTASIGSALRTLFPGVFAGWILWAPAFVVLLVSGVLGFYLKNCVSDLRDAVCLITPFALAFAPYAWAHDTVILLPTSFWFVQFVAVRLSHLSWLDRLPMVLIWVLGGVYSFLVAYYYRAPIVEFTPYLVAVVVSVSIAAIRRWFDAGVVRGG